MLAWDAVSPGWVRRVLVLLGIDSAIAFTVLWRGWNAVAGPVSLFLVAFFLTPPEQGYYFTFASIVALRVFFELGFGTVVLQFASHEKAFLHWTNQGILEGTASAKERLASLLRLLLKWYAIVAVCFVVGVMAAGYFFFLSSNPGSSVHWQWPWALLILATSLLIPVSPLLSLMEGCGLVPQVARMRFVDAFLSNIVCWGALALHLGLFAAPALTLMSAIVQSGWLILTKRTVLADLLVTPRTENQISWAAEIWPFQWRIAVSWLSGYFVFQLFNPVIFRYWGPVEAGRMGLAVTLTTGILIIGISWLNTKAPLFGALIVQRKFAELDRVYFAALYRSLAVVVATNLCVFAGVIYLRHIGSPWSGRVLSPLGLAALMGGATINVLIFGQSIYLRAHKQEPFLMLSVVLGLCTMVTTLVCGRWFGSSAVAVSFFLITATVGACWATRIFETRRRDWHRHPDSEREISAA